MELKIGTKVKYQNKDGSFHEGTIQFVEPSGCGAGELVYGIRRSDGILDLKKKQYIIEIKEGYLPFMEYKTYYRIANPKGKKTPLLILHGGPGSTHNAYEIFDWMAYLDDRPIVSYDQLGCGLSFVPEGNTHLWCKETWVKELMNVRYQLGLGEIHLMGQSWGGMLNIIYNCDYQPVGVKTMILSSTLSSVKLWEMETHRLVRLMSEEDQKNLFAAEKENDWNTKERQLSLKKYYETYIGGPFDSTKDPECICRPKNSGPESYLTAWGPSEFAPNGTLKDYEYTDKLKYISVPVLITSGVNDESTPFQNKVMFDTITAEKKWILYPQSRHMAYYEEHESYAKNLMEFLNDND